MEDGKIISKIKSRDANGLELLIDEYGRLIYSVISKVIILDNKDDCIKECFNDVLLSLWENIEAYDRSKGEFINFLIAVSKYKAIDYIRHNKKKFNETELESVYGEVLSKEDDYEVLNNADEFYRLISVLKEDEKQIFIKRYLFLEDVKKIAFDMKISENNVYIKLSRGREKIKKSLGGVIYE